MPTTRTQEMNVRRKAQRQGLRLRGRKRRDPQAVDYGLWRIETARGRVLVKGDLDSIKAWLSTPRDQRP